MCSASTCRTAVISNKMNKKQELYSYMYINARNGIFACVKSWIVLLGLSINLYTHETESVEKL